MKVYAGKTDRKANAYTVKKWVVTVAQPCVSIGTIANLLSSVLTILLTCPNNDTVLCYSNDPFLTVYRVVGNSLNPIVKSLLHCVAVLLWIVKYLSLRAQPKGEGP